MPVYKHNCSKCQYLGTFRIGTSRGNEVTDLYFHRSDTEVTVVARNSDEESEYSSGLEIPSRELLIATILSVKKGLLSIEELPNYWVEED